MRFRFLVAVSMLTLYSCNHAEEKPRYNISLVDSFIISKDFYRKYSVSRFNFNDSTIYVDEQNKPIKKITFFKKIYENYHFPLKSLNANSFKLITVRDWPDEDIQSWVRGVGYQNYKKEILIGKTLLKTGLEDIDGNLIDSVFLKDKLVFVNCWFIKCTACVAEMPYLNTIVDSMKHRTDVAFLSFAYNKKEDLEKFLLTRTFKFKVIPTYNLASIDSLQITTFPTTMFVRNNEIVKVVEPDEILPLIEKYSNY